MISRFLKYAIPVAALLLATSPVSADTLTDARTAGTINVGVGLMGTKPFVWQNDSGGYEGMEADMAKEIVKRIGIKDFKYVTTEWSTLIPGLKANRWDLIITGLAKTEERIQGGGIAMSDPYAMIYDVIIVDKDSPIKSKEDLKNKSIATVLGTVDSLVAHSVVDAGSAAEVKDFNTYAEPFMALKNKQADAVLIDQLTYDGFKLSLPDIKVVGEPLLYKSKPEWAAAQEKANYNLGAIGVGVRIEDKTLLDAVNKALADMDADGTRKKILEKYGVWDDLQVRKAMMK